MMTSRTINPEMLILAREYRNVTQQELAQAIGISQGKIAKIEGGMTGELTDEQLALIGARLDFPLSFFQQLGQRIGFGSSALYYRRRTDITAPDRKRIAGVVNLLRLGLRKLLESVELDASKKLPRFDLEELGGSPKLAADYVRALWQLPDGPISNLTAEMEAAGIVIIPCRFDCRAMDATSLRLADMPPMIFINDDLPGDRWRFTLAHELAHLVLHETPRETMEDEADAFAAELLMPEADMIPLFRRLPSVRLQDLADMKPYWRVAIAALLMRASSLGFVSPNQKQYLWRQMNAMGIRQEEPIPLAREMPATFPGLIRYFEEDLHFSPADFSKLLHLRERDTHEVFGAKDAPPVRRLRAV
jgi:Zn-dependent peptidase ImmA (M78 family)/DNA-binding XRE family transcriptional regulator